YALATFFGGLELWLLLFFFTSTIIVILSAVSFIRKQDKRQSIGILVLGIILFSSSYQYIEAQEAEKARIEQQEQEAQAEKERLAEEKKQQEIARKKEQERIEEEKKLKEQIIKAIEKVEEEPTKSNYNKAINLLNKLDDKDERLVERLNTIKSAVDEYEEELKLAKEAVEKAESELSRENYNEAYKLVVTLSIPNSQLDRQLEALDQKITKIEEEERIAAEKAEAERVAAEKAEAERVAAEKAAQEKEKKQAAQNSKQQTSSASQPKQVKTSEATQATNVEKVVYVAPQSGTKYHFSANCRGLNRANSIKEMSLTEAKSQGYDLCGWEK